MSVSPAPSQAGIALVESLVAVTLLSTALVATLATLAQAIAAEREAARHGVALRHATSLADQLRHLVRADGTPLQAVADPSSAAECGAFPADCSLERLAVDRLLAWHTATLADLPDSGEARIGVLATSPPAYEVLITWPSRGRDSRAQLRLAIEP